MPGTTPNRSYPFPLATEPPAGDAQIQALATALDTDVTQILADVFAHATQTATRGATDTGSGTAVAFNAITLPAMPAGAVWEVEWWMMMTAPAAVTARLIATGLDNCSSVTAPSRFRGTAALDHWMIKTALTVATPGACKAGLQLEVLAGTGTWTVDATSRYFAKRVR